jgi:hypothetical protein
MGEYYVRCGTCGGNYKAWAADCLGYRKDIEKGKKSTQEQDKEIQHSPGCRLEAKWATESEVEEAKSPILVMAEEDAIKIEQETRQQGRKVPGSNQ